MKHAKQVRKISYRSSTQQGEKVPCLPLQGLFMNSLNLPVGTMVNVEYGNGFVHISRIIKNRYGNPDDYATAISRI